MKRSRKLLAGAVLLLVVILGSAELFCRFYLGLGDPPLSRTDPEIEYMFVGPRTYHRFGHTIAYNTYAMRSREFDARRKDPRELRILVCGDSVINGGALTDQADLATTRIEQRLQKEFDRPAVVMNVSAGSWGPPNYLAYVKRYGTFEANALIIVVSSHDASDAPTWEPVVGVSPDFPAQTPTFALEEALTRYLPRYLPGWLKGSSGAGTPAMLATQGQFDQAMGAFKELIALASSRNIPVIIVQHFEAAELGKPEWEGHRLLRKAAQASGVVPVDLESALAQAVSKGTSPYRDNDPIHLNVLGQRLLEEAIYGPLVRALEAQDIRPTASK